jgi:RNA polymerase sigma factor (sigma-70 family)
MRMVWQDMSPFPTPRMDAEEEREMRLAAQARAGAEWALAALIARYQPPVLRYLTRLTGNASQSQDLAERIFVRMERRLRGPHGGEHLRLWLLRAATETGLDVLRHPKRSQQSRLNAPAGPRGLLMDGLPGSASERLRAGLDRLAAITGSTRRQVRQLVWNAGNEATPDAAPRSQASKVVNTPPAVDPEIDTMNPQEALRHRLVRAVLAELPYGDAQCLALHLVAGMNQTEVARALGIRPSAARHRIVQGLQMFAHRYDAAITSLGVPAEVAYADDGQSLPAPVVDVMETLEMLNTSGHDYPVPMAPMEDSGYPVSGTMAAAEAAYPNAVGEAYDETYVGAYDLTEAPVAESAASEVPSPMIVDALPATVAEELPDGNWLDQPTMVPILSLSAEPAAVNLDATDEDEDEDVDVASGTPDARASTDATTEVAAETPPSVPVLTPLDSL